MDRICIIVNGYATTGKDTLIANMAEWFEASGYRTHTFSSIDPVRGMLTRAGYDTSAKTSDDRDLLSAVGDAVETYCQARSMACIAEASRHFCGRPRAVVFLHTREPKVIERIRLGVQGFARFRTVLLTRPNVERVETNHSDRNVMSVPYDDTIANDGSLADLMVKARGYVDGLIDAHARN